MYEEARSARVGKLKKAGYKTRAAVIVLPDSSLFRRQRKQHQEEGKSVPETTIADMRGVWTLCCAYRLCVFVSGVSASSHALGLVLTSHDSAIGSELFA